MGCCGEGAPEKIIKKDYSKVRALLQQIVSERGSINANARSVTVLPRVTVR